MRLMRIALTVLVAGALVAGVQGATKTAKKSTAKRKTVSKETLATAADLPTADEIAKMTAMLSDKPVAFGKPIADRATWDKLAQSQAGKDAIRAAERVLTTPMPEKTEEIMLTYSKTGSRSQCDRVDGQRRGRVKSLVAGELLENKGRFIPELEKTIRALAAEKSWVGTAHDGNLANYKGTIITIDLYSSALAWNLATADVLLGDKLSPEIRQLLRQEARRRIFDPFHRMIEGKQSRYWLMHEHNWNSVCLAGTIGTALALLDTKEEKALFVLATMKYSQVALKGYTADGYCGEGTGYWNYGFGHYILLSEVIRLATDSKVDLLAVKAALPPATFGPRFEIVNGIYPAFADSSPGDRPSPTIVNFLNERFKLGLDMKATRSDRLFGKGNLFEDMMYTFPVPYTAAVQSAPVQVGVRSWFDAARILISRPATGSACRLATAIIGADNGVNHNHNDVGSFIVVLGDQSPILDAGGESYTARTFSARRYESNALNSFGHSCPLVAGKMQDTGAKAKAVTLKTDFTDAQDTLAFDIRSAYSVPELKTLTRQYVYSREGAGSLTVTDEVAFEKPETFETALITCGKWQQVGPKTLKIEDGGEAILVEIETGGKAFEVKATEINEHVHTKVLPTRLGIALKEPTAQATVSVKITPAK